MTDYISRQEAIDALMAWEEDSIWDEDCLKHRGEPFWIAPSDVICDLPAADVRENKRGKWVMDRLVTTTGGTYGVRRCSECEAYYQDVGYGWNYCPNCGADMRGGEGDGE